MTPPAGANVCRVSVTLPYTTTSASVARSETVVWTHDASAGDDASVAQNSTAAIKTNARTRSLTGFRRTRGGSGSLGRLSAEERAQPVAECLEDRDGDQSVLPDHVVELGPREHQTFHRAERGDRRGAGPTVEKRDLPKKSPGPSSRRWRPWRRTSAVPVRMTKNSPPLAPSRQRSRPATKSTSSTCVAMKASCLSSHSANRGTALSIAIRGSAIRGEATWSGERSQGGSVVPAAGLEPALRGF